MGVRCVAAGLLAGLMLAAARAGPSLPTASDVDYCTKRCAAPEGGFRTTYACSRCKTPETASDVDAQLDHGASSSLSSQSAEQQHVQGPAAVPQGEAAASLVFKLGSVLVGLSMLLAFYAGQAQLQVAAAGTHVEQKSRTTMVLAGYDFGYDSSAATRVRKDQHPGVEAAKELLRSELLRSELLRSELLRSQHSRTTSRSCKF